MQTFGWPTIIVLALLLASGVGLIIADKAEAGGALTGAAVLIALALFGVNKAKAK